MKKKSKKSLKEYQNPTNVDSTYQSMTSKRKFRSAYQHNGEETQKKLGIEDEKDYNTEDLVDDNMSLMKVLKNIVDIENEQDQERAELDEVDEDEENEK